MKTACPRPIAETTFSTLLLLLPRSLRGPIPTARSRHAYDSFEGPQPGRPFGPMTMAAWPHRKRADRSHPRRIGFQKNDRPEHRSIEWIRICPSPQTACLVTSPSAYPDQPPHRTRISHPDRDHTHEHSLKPTAPICITKQHHHPSFITNY